MFFFILFSYVPETWPYYSAPVTAKILFILFYFIYLFGWGRAGGGAGHTHNFNPLPTRIPTKYLIHTCLNICMYSYQLELTISEKKIVLQIIFKLSTTSEVMRVGCSLVLLRIPHDQIMYVFRWGLMCE